MNNAVSRLMCWRSVLIVFCVLIGVSSVLGGYLYFFHKQGTNPAPLVTAQELALFGTNIDPFAAAMVQPRQGYVIKSAVINNTGKMVVYSEVRPCLVQEYADSIHDISYKERRTCSDANVEMYSVFIKDVTTGVISAVPLLGVDELLPSRLTVQPDHWIYDQYIVFTWVNLSTDGNGGLPRYQTFLYNVYTQTFSTFTTGESRVSGSDPSKVIYVDAAGTDSPIMDEGSYMLSERIIFKDVYNETETVLVEEPNTHYDILDYSENAVVYVSIPFNKEDGKPVLEKNAAKVSVIPLWYYAPIVK